MAMALFIVAAAFVGLALVQAALMVLQTWEHRRFARSRLARLDACRPQGRAMIFLPCKGLDIGLEENLQSFFYQDYDDYEITFVVETPWDPACNRIAQIMAENPHRASHLVIAGRAAVGGQKVHNLRVAIQRKLSSRIEFLVFADSDARPGTSWLRALVGRLGDESRNKDVGAATGYRWMVPTRPTRANHLLYSVNCNVATLLGPRSNYPVWGGSWAIRRTTFEKIGLLDAWRGTLSDDLVATQTLRRHGLGARFEPACVVASPIDGTLLDHWWFVRRQYTISRFYTPRLWAAGLSAAALTIAGWLAATVLLAWSIVAGSPLTTAALGASLGLYGLGLARGAIRQQLVEIYVADYGHQLRGARRFDVWANPLIGLASALAMVSSCVGRHIRWRDITYCLHAGGAAEVVARASLAAATLPAVAESVVEPEVIHWPKLSDEGEARQKAA
jgi:ceramide glucosyltransferase